MDLGNFSVSLAVKSLAESRAFYEKLGFKVVDGNNTNWVIMQNPTSTIGLFEGMFDKNILTFNPGSDRSGSNIDPFVDVREIQKALKAQGVGMQMEVDETTSGPGHAVFVDPDGNIIMLDQHR